MGISQQTVITIKCEGKIQFEDSTPQDCPHEIVFEASQQEQAIKDNPWMRNIRTIIRGNNEKFTYCSDECEVSGITAGNHNFKEPKQVVDIQAGAQAAIRVAAEAAKRRQGVDAAMRKGPQPVEN